MTGKEQLDKDQKLKQLEDKISQLENIIALMPGNVYWLDRNNIFQGCNKNQADAAKLSSPKDILGKVNKDMIWKNQAKELDEINLRVMETGEPSIVEEIAKMSNGIGVYLSQKVPLRNEENEIVGLLGVSFDITERKRIEKEIQQAKEKAELANQTKTDFIRNMEHDIRTPLCGIIGVANYLKLKELNPQRHELLGDIELASNELIDYLNNILEFSQINTGAIPFILREFNLKEVIDSVFYMELPAAKDKRIDLLINYPDDVPLLFIGDKFRIHRILINLVSNAIKFTDTGHVRISVNLVRQPENNALVEISVADSGIGIAKKHQDLIYEKFMRCAPANRGIYKGTGLGLWIVKQFIDELRGEINLHSDLGKGSTFIFSVPLKISILEKEACAS